MNIRRNAPRSLPITPRKGNYLKSAKKFTQELPEHAQDITFPDDRQEMYPGVSRAALMKSIYLRLARICLGSVLNVTGYPECWISKRPGFPESIQILNILRNAPRSLPNTPRKGNFLTNARKFTQERPEHTQDSEFPDIRKETHPGVS